MMDGSIRITKEPGERQVKVEHRNAAGTAIYSEARTTDSRNTILHETHRVLANASPDESPTLLIFVRLGVDAMQRAEDVRRAVHKAMHEEGLRFHGAMRPGWNGSVSDRNGAIVGRWEVR